MRYRGTCTNAQSNWSGKMDNIAKLAVEIHKRDNKRVIGPCVGTVTSASEPITVSICDGAVILEQGSNARVCQNLVERTCTAKISDDEVTVTHQSGESETVRVKTDKTKAELKEVLKNGDEVLCIPCSGEQTWIIVDKVVS